MPTIRIPAPLRVYSNYQSSVKVEGATVGAALNNLTEQYADMHQHLFEGDQLRSFVNIYLNQENVQHLDGAETALNDDDTLMIIPAMAGG